MLNACCGYWLPRLQIPVVGFFVPPLLALGLPFFLLLRDTLCCAVFQPHSTVIIIGGLVVWWNSVRDGVFSNLTN